MIIRANKLQVSNNIVDLFFFFFNHSTHSYSLPQLSEEEQETLEQQRADKSLFAQELLLSTLVYSDSSSDSSDREET